MASSTPNREAIHAAFVEVIGALEHGELEPAAGIFSHDAWADTSQADLLRGRADIVAGLSTFLVPSGGVRYFLANEYISTDGDQAQQSAYLSVALIQAGGTAPAVSWFGGHFANSWQRNAQQWQITGLRFEQDWAHGRHPALTTWPETRSRLGWEPGSTLPKTVSALDAPWRVIPENAEPGGDEQQIIDAFTRYTWAVDQWDLELLRDIFAEDLTTDIVPFGPLRNRREFLSTLQLFRSGRVSLHHAMGDTQVQVEGPRATLKVFRLVPYNGTPDSLERDVYGATYDCTARREGGLWKFDSITYTEGQLFEMVD
ncbi:nuclear transport factor 2 family protein [Nesterenkonia cremea]|uniref:SnoaL-like domain-containing protein n=1 Tax=Nesterenkonia cremea TaxID=1882340 RepID=A0A917ENL9_9MICC|nr:nuclear transport factor 2 family protein [Nesterenkonia cremea]GGE67528.1 hypothetical protein GCM10011401_13610 [Nesterenkonia cremea]